VKIRREKTPDLLGKLQCPQDLGYIGMAFQPLEIGLILFPDFLVDGSNFSEMFRTVSKKVIQAAMLKDAIEWS